MGAGRYELGVRVPPEKSDDGKSHMKLRNGQNNWPYQRRGLREARLVRRGKCQGPPHLHPPIGAEPTDPDRRPDSQKPQNAPRYRVHSGLRRRNIPRQLSGLAQARLDTHHSRRHVAAKILAERFGGDPNSADWRHFGRLAGFTNPKPQYRLPNGLFPYSQLKFALSKGVIYQKTHEVLSEVEDRLLDQYEEVSEVYPDAHRLPETSHGRNLNFSTTPTSPTNMPRTVNGTRQTFPMPPTHSSEASPKLKSETPFVPIPQHLPSSTAPSETKTPISTAP